MLYIGVDWPSSALSLFCTWLAPRVLGTSLSALSPPLDNDVDWPWLAHRIFCTQLALHVLCTFLLFFSYNNGVEWPSLARRIFCTRLTELNTTFWARVAAILSA